MSISKLKRSVLIGMLMLICFTVGAYAADGIKEVKAFLREDYKVKLDGRDIKLENAALIYKDYSYLPLRELGLLLGVEIGWDDKTKTVSLTSPVAVVEPDTSEPESPIVDNNTGSNTSGTIKYPAEFMFSNVLIYKITLDSKAYYVLANEKDNIIYFRKSDVELMNLDLSGLVTVREKHTLELFYPANELSSRLNKPGNFEVSVDPIIRETNVEILKALKAYLPASNSLDSRAFYIRTLPGTNQYEALLQDSERRFFVYSLKIFANSNGTYYVGSNNRDYLYD